MTVLEHINHKNNVWALAFLGLLSYGSFLGARLAQADQVLLEDHFNRPDSPSLGAPWTEQGEFTSEFTLPNGRLIGPGFIEINNGTLAFHFITHSQRLLDVFNSGSSSPSAFAPLSSPVTSFPVTVSYTFTPHRDEATVVGAALISGAHGFTSNEPPLNYQSPNVGLRSVVGRSGSPYNNSSMIVDKFDNGILGYSVLGSISLPFQLEFGNTYSVKFTIAQDFSTTLQVSDGISTSSLSTGPTSFTTPLSLDQFFLNSGGYSYDAQGLGDFIFRVDDVLVTQAGLTVQIDIKPGSYPNCFSLNGNGVIPVAILGSADFDVNDINTASLSFAGLRVRVRGNNTPSCATEYSNNDQFLDMVCHFEDDPASWRGGSDTAELSGNLIDGTSFKGTDSICIVP
jgi:hypothetical protein